MDTTLPKNPRYTLKNKSPNLKDDWSSGYGLQQLTLRKAVQTPLQTFLFFSKKNPENAEKTLKMIKLRWNNHDQFCWQQAQDLSQPRVC